MSDDPESPLGSPRRPSLGLLAGVAGAVVVLAAVGATGGWLLAGSGDGDPVAESSPTVSTYRSPTPDRPEPATTTPTRPEQTTLKPGAFELPDVTGSDFRDARRKLRALRLGVQVIFKGGGDDHSVEDTAPRPGTFVKAGVTVKLQVRGGAPQIKVPNLVGTPCAAAGREAVEQGFTPGYVPKKVGLGTVVRQEPVPTAEAYWNDRITLYCETTPSLMS